ncbi:MAG: thermonuclease family protein [Desulfomonile sp.]|nr:thermonuclease family protein [Desulfomonile sp.]
MDLIIGYVMDAARWTLIVLLTWLYPADFTAWPGKVTEVIRADEIKVKHGSKLETVRLYGIDSPIWWETSNSGAGLIEAKLQEEDLLSGETTARTVTPKPYPQGDQALTYTKGRVLDKLVMVQPLPARVEGPWYKPKLHVYDRYNRIIAMVSVEGENLNKELVRKGMAWWYRPFVPFERGFKRLQDLAEADRAGLWAAKNPQPPWKWQGTVIEKLHPLQRGGVSQEKK